jgi:hypothetical protein
LSGLVNSVLVTGMFIIAFKAFCAAGLGIRKTL